MRDWPYPLWIAHRGAGKLAPENTLAAFRVGASHGYRAFECDVKLSADGVPFLLHDATLDRTTDGIGLAAQRTWSTLACLDAGSWHSRAYAGEPLPGLASIATYCRRNGYALNIEIKPSPDQDVPTGAVVGAAAARLWAGDALPPVLSSFSVEALEAARSAAPGLPRALLLDHLNGGWWESVQSLDCAAVVCNHVLIDAAWVSRVRGSGRRALAYTVNDPVQARRLIALGLDGLITDQVDRFAPARGDAP